MEIKDIYKFCSRCGSETKFIDNHADCAKCGLSVYDNPRPTVGLILYNERNEYLLVERAVDPGKGLLDTPGGFVENYETLEEGARRELKEELAIEVGKLHYVGSTTEPYLFKGVTYPTLVAIFVAKISSTADLKPADDVADYKFYDRDNLPIEKFAFKSMADDFELASKFLAKQSE